MYCSNCGSKIREGAAFCPRCGNRIGGAQREAAQPAPSTPPTGGPQPAPAHRKRSRRALAIGAVAIAVLAIAAIAAALVLGWSPFSNGSANTETRNGNGSDSTPATSTEETEESSAGSLEVYQTVIDQYAQAYRAYLDGTLAEDSMADEQCEGASDYWTWPISDDYPYVTQDILFESWRYYDEGSLSNWYCLVDVNGNGTEELLIGDTEEDGDSVFIWAIFTCEDGTVVPLFASAYRTSYWPCEDGTIGGRSSGGAGTGCYGYYTFDGSSISETESLSWENDSDWERYTYTRIIDGAVVASGTEEVDDCPELTQLWAEVPESHPATDLDGLEWVAIEADSDASQAETSDSSAGSDEQTSLADAYTQLVYDPDGNDVEDLFDYSSVIAFSPANTGDYYYLGELESGGTVLWDPDCQGLFVFTTAESLSADERDELAEWLLAGDSIELARLLEQYPELA